MVELSISNLTPSKPEQERVQVLIIGSGPAGLSAALYAARADLNPVVLTGMELGGQVSLTYIVENYPGFPDGVGGAEMVELFQKQAERFGARIEFDTATEVDFSQRPFKVKTYNGEYLAESVIITTGATPKHLDIPGEVELTGRGVSYCATCDGWFFKDKDVVVIGGGDSALEEGLFLTRYAKSVTIVHRRDELRAGAILQKRASGNPKIKFIWNTIITDILGEEAVTGIRMKNVTSGEVIEHPIDGVFIFIGHNPNTELFNGQLDMDKLGYLIVDQLMRTRVPGVYAAGEVADPTFRQVVTSAGMGAAAAMQAIHFIEANTESQTEIIAGS
ncbi:MAG: thioredoxin-disulfide reductase [Anaerolineales bacterium]|nr:MAG: thioredoxin-disulfide reductase [Anaerolineales bacterium]